MLRWPRAALLLLCTALAAAASALDPPSLQAPTAKVPRIERGAAQRTPPALGTATPASTPSLGPATGITVVPPPAITVHPPRRRSDY
jgi:hypothetical protein